MTQETSRPHLVLASKSPARLATLRAAGIEPEVMVSHVDEEAIEASLPDATPAEIAQVLATAKAEEVARQVQGPAIVVGCDSVFEIDGVAYGKPGGIDVAREWWRLMLGRSGTLHTGHHVIRTDTGDTAGATSSTVVHMGSMSEREMDDYLATGEPIEVAGGFTLDGLGGAFIDSIEGDPSTVIGISLPTLRRLLAQVGVTWTTLWSPTTTGEDA